MITMQVCVKLTCLLTVVLLTPPRHRITSSGQKAKSHYHFIRIVPSSIEDVVNLNTLEEVYEEDDQAIFLRSAGPPGTPIDIVLNEESFYSFTEDLDAVDIKYTVENVQEKLAGKLRKRRDVSGVEYDHTRYHRYDEIVDWLKILANRYKSIASLFTIGKTFEGRDMYVMKISTNNGVEREKRGIWLEGGIHAREKISPATVVFIVEQLLEQYGNNDMVTNLLDGIIWYILPVVNIDGYEYSMIPVENVTSIRDYFNMTDVPYTVWQQLFWRKTRSTNEFTSCIGVDPNRNWDYKWKASDVNTSCLSNDPGPKPFSEVEIKNIADFILEHSYIDAYISVHSYGQLFIFPWCWTTEKVQRYDELTLLAKKASKAVQSVYGTEYKYGSVTEILTKGRLLGGCSCDWTYEVAGITYSYGLELRDTGVYGFLLPENQIRPTGIETLEGIKEIAKHLISLDDHNAAVHTRLSTTLQRLIFHFFIALCLLKLT